MKTIERVLDEQTNVVRVKKDIQCAKLSSAYLKTAPKEYYSWTLNQRGYVLSIFFKRRCTMYLIVSLFHFSDFLKCSVPHLCKSIIVENCASVNKGIDDPNNSRQVFFACELVTSSHHTIRFYCVVVQYNAKLNTEELMRFVRGRLPDDKRPARKAFNFQHADGQVVKLKSSFSTSACILNFNMKHRLRKRSLDSSTTECVLLV